MTFPFNPNLPVPTDDPSQDVAGMQTNSMSTYMWAGVDHIQYGNTGAGTHSKVTFAGNSVPVVDPVTPPILFTNIQDGASPPNNLPGGLAQLFYYSGGLANAMSNYTCASNGSILLFGGIVLKWGVGTANSTGSVVNTFAKPFINNIFSLIVNYSSNPGGSPAAVLPTSITKTSFNAVSPFASVGIYYIAIGN